MCVLQLCGSILFYRCYAKDKRTQPFDPLCVECERPCNDETKVPTVTVGVASTGLTLRQAVQRSRKNSSTRTQLISHSFKASTEEHFFEGIDNSCNLSLGRGGNEATDPMDTKSSNDISVTITATIRICATHDCDHT